MIAFKQFLGSYYLQGAHLISKANVAAGKQPDIKLGVIGVTIGQKRPTGDTSKVTRAVISTKASSK